MGLLPNSWEGRHLLTALAANQGTGAGIRPGQGFAANLESETPQGFTSSCLQGGDLYLSPYLLPYYGAFRAESFVNILRDTTETQLAT